MAEIAAAVARMKDLALAFEKVYRVAKPSAAAAKAIYQTERALQLPDGLPGRPWYKHALTAPGQYTGYGAKTLPGVRESLELDKPSEAVTQARALILVMGRFNNALAEAVKLTRA